MITSVKAIKLENGKGDVYLLEHRREDVPLPRMKGQDAVRLGMFGNGPIFVDCRGMSEDLAESKLEELLERLGRNGFTVVDQQAPVVH